MVLKIPDSGLQLDGSSKAMATLPPQAFSISLSDDVIGNLIKCVKGGQAIQLSLGNVPTLLFDHQEVQIPDAPDNYEFDVFRSNTTPTTKAIRFPAPATSLFKAPKEGSKQPEAPKPKPKPKALPRASSMRQAMQKPASSQESSLGPNRVDVVATLQKSSAKAESKTRENSTGLVAGLPVGKASKMRGGAKATRLLGAQSISAPRSRPSSPALSGFGSPPLGPSASSTQERNKQQRFPVIHELAAQEQTFDALLAKYQDGGQDELEVVLKKAADFDEKLQKWVLKKLYWKELDIFSYGYSSDEDRQKAIDNAIKHYDRMRLGPSDPLWQKLLPKSERGKGVCLSKLQAKIEQAAQPAPPKVIIQKAGSPSISGADSEKDESAGRKKGGEPMSRTGSQTKKKMISASEAQAKRLLANSKKAASTTARLPPKISPTKPKAAAVTSTAKGGRMLSKEFVTDSDDEVPLSTSIPKRKPAPAQAAKPTGKPKAPIVKKKELAALASTAKATGKAQVPNERPKEVSAPTMKVAAAAKAKLYEKERERARERERERGMEKEKEKETIRRQPMDRPKASTAVAWNKRPREADDDSGSSSGVPMSKRSRLPAKPRPAPLAPQTQKTKTIASDRNSMHVRPKNTSPLKSSPLASSPPTNASDLEPSMPDTIADTNSKKRKATDDTVSTSSSTSADSNVAIKKIRLSDHVVDLARRFKVYYRKYAEKHKVAVAKKNPDPEEVADLIEMRERLQNWKTMIQREVEQRR